MNEEVQMALDMAKESMEDALKHLDKELQKLRAGKANPAILDGVKVDYYGAETPLNQVANVNITDARTIMIQPWEKTMIDPIEKAIMKANLGFNPQNNGEVVRIIVPALTEERRRDLVKQVKSIGETAKISIRNSRRDTNDELKRLKKEGVSEDVVKDNENRVQALTNDFIKKVDEVVDLKEKDIMTI